MTPMTDERLDELKEEYRCRRMYSGDIHAMFAEIDRLRTELAECQQVADKLACVVRAIHQNGYKPKEVDMQAALFAYEAAKGHDDTTPPTASAEERFEGVK